MVDYFFKTENVVGSQKSRLFSFILKNGLKQKVNDNYIYFLKGVKAISRKKDHCRNLYL